MAMRTRKYYIICIQKGPRPADDDPILHQHTSKFESQKMFSILKKAEENGGQKVYATTRFC